MYTRFVCSCLSLCIVCKYVCLCSSMLVCSYMYFLLSRFLYVNPNPFSTLQRQNLLPGKPYSSLAFSCTVVMVGYSRDAVYLLSGVRIWPSQTTYSLWLSRTVLYESPVASAVCFTTAILLMADLHAFSFSTICLVCDLSLKPFLPGFQATLFSSELLKFPAPSVHLLFKPIPTYYV